MNKRSRIFVAGHGGLVGSAICRRLEREGYEQLIVRSHGDLDLRDQAAVNGFFDEVHPEFVILAAAKVGGILANSTRPAEFLYDNLAISANVISASCRTAVRKLINLGSSCIYPRLSPQPIREEYLLTGALEDTNRAYAVAKIAAIELCDGFRRQFGCDFISAMPSNLYGPGDNFDLSSSHVLPAIIRKCHEAKLSGAETVEVWGSGEPRRELMHVDDLADAVLFLMDKFSGLGPINVGTGQDCTVLQLAELVRSVVGYKGRLSFDTSKPDGTPRKLLDVSKIRELGWSARIGLEEGIRSTYEWYREHGVSGR